MDTIAQTMGARVRQRRLAAGLSEAEVAQAAGLSVSDLAKAEGGEMRFSPEAIVALSAVLRVVPSWFFDDAAE